MTHTPKSHRAPVLLSFTLALVMALGMSLRLSGGWPGTALRNPDSYMRMVRLRDIVDSGTALSVVARDGSGHGTVLHWSHLLDGMLLVLAAPFRLGLDLPSALHAEALAFGPLTAAAAGAGVVWAATPFARRSYVWLGAILTILAPTIMSYGVIGTVHHHVLAVLVAVVCWGAAARLIAVPDQPRQAVTLGVAAALGIWLTPETVPVTIPAFLALWVTAAVSLDRADLARAIGVSGAWFAAVTAAAWLLDPPATGHWVPEVDRISILFVGMAGAVGCAGAGPALARRWTSNPWGRLLVMAGVGIGCTAVWGVLFWPTLARTDVTVNSADQHAFFDAITEMLPIRDWPSAIGYLTTGALTALCLGWLAVRRRSVPLAFACLVLLVFMAVGAMHIRFTAYSQAAGAIALPVLLTLISDAWEPTRPTRAVLGRMAGLVLFIIVPFLGVFAGQRGEAGAPGAAAIPAASCDLADGASLLTPYPGAVVLTDVNDTPEVLYRAQVRTVGSLYHRNIPGFMRLRAAWRSLDSLTVPPAIDAAEVTLILACPDPARSALVADLSPETLYDRLRAGNTPPWLRAVGSDPRSGYRLWEVIR
jgi:hypothetical protein